ncbi:MAG: outer membrane beta-barrel family protein [Ginsengibacter sp.]
MKLNSTLLKYFTCRFTFCIVLILCISSICQAQQTNVTVKIINKQSHPVPFSTIKVLPVNDSAHSFQQVTDSAGKATFDLKHDERYNVIITSVNYAVFEKGITIKNENPSFTFMLENAATTLNTVIIKSNKPLMRQEDDKTIVDPENLVASSTSGYEVIEKTPGLFVDQDGNIYLNSTTPASIYINGREQKMSTADVASLLKSLPPNAIASIEILRTPSAKYDASGSGGIVNVVLKKGVKIGLTGSANAGLSQGKYGTQYAGFNLSNNNGNLSSYINLQITYKNTYDEIKTDRTFAPDSLLSQDAFTVYPGNTYYLGYGINRQLNKKWELSYDGRMSLSDAHNQSENTSRISKISSDETFADNIALVTNKNNSFFLSQGVSSKLKIDSLGSEWTNDISYNYSPNNTDQNFTTNFLLPVISSATGDGFLKTNLNFLSAETNLVLKFPANFLLETGLKTTITGFKNSTSYFHIINGVRTKDDVRTSSYDFKENIGAAYLQASKTLFGITLKAGTRVENTSMKGRQHIPTDTTFNINRTDFFPYIYLSRPLMKIMGYSLRAYLVYRKTISRPGYQLLNPSQRYIDPYLFETGNPKLRPQFTRNYEANVSVDERPIFALGVNDTKDIFTNVVYQADTSKRTAYRTYDNLGNNKETYFRILGAIPPGGKYFIVAGAQYNHNFYQGFYDGLPLSYKKGSLSFFSYQTFKLSPTSQITLNGFARFNGQQQFYELTPFGALNLSINKQLLQKKLTVTISGNDLFYTNNNNFTLLQGSISASGYRKSDTRRLGVNVRYNFGIRKKEEKAFINNLDASDRTGQ